jgi:signal transduction histidine kinase/CheY-like chemotaxis protein
LSSPYFTLREIATSRRISREVFEHQQTEQELDVRNELLPRLNKARKESEAANRAKSDFLSSMNHELRTPLNAVLGYAKLLDLNPTEPLSAKQKTAVDSISEGGQHLLDLINQILELSKIEAGKLELSIETLNPMIAVEECLVIARTMAEPCSITAENNALKKDIPFIRADLTRFKQLMLNLLSNSVKYNKDGGSVTVDAEATSNDMLRISISDTGAGIPEKEHDKVFEPFERFGMKSTEIEGTGIGLTISKQLVELMGGSTGFESEAGKGSTFWIELPIAEAGDHVLTSNNPIQDNKTSELPLLNDGQITRILYVEDNEMNVELMKSIFDDMLDAELIIATTGEDGVELAKSQHPNLILMDIGLPGISGIEATNILKQTEDTRDIPIIVITAAAMKDEVERAKAVDFYAYLTKPIDIAKTLKVVQQALSDKDDHL